MLSTAALASPAAARPDEGGHATDPAAREKSRAAFRRGVAQLRAQDWAGARASFEEAWALVQHPSILLNLGIARLRTDDPVLAESDLVRFLSDDSGAAPEEIASARDALAEARSKIGTLRIVAQPASARVVVDGKALAVSAGVAEARLKGGKHSLAVEADGFTREERTVTVPAKSDTEIRVSLKSEEAPKAAEPPPKPAPPPPAETTSMRTIAGWTLGGVGAVALVASGAMALHSLSLSDEYSAGNRGVRDEGVAYRTGADVALAVGLVAGAGAVILLFTNIGESNPADVLRRPLLRW
jgi:hypothetical protein